MKTQDSRNLAILITFASVIVLLSSNQTNAQGMYSSSSGGWSTGYGTVYGSHGYALATQDMYRMTQKMINENMMRNASGSGSSSRTKGSTSSSGSKTTVAPTRVIRNHGVFRPDTTVDTGEAMADAIGTTPEEKALIKKIYAATKANYEKEAATRGWKNNVAGALTFFTATAMTVYHDAAEPSADAANNYFKAVNSALDEMPEFAGIPNKDKQTFDNVLVGFSGIMLAGYSEAKQNNDADGLVTSKKLAGMLIQMVLKTDPENLRLENGQIVLK